MHVEGLGPSQDGYGAGYILMKKFWSFYNVPSKPSESLQSRLFSMVGGESVHRVGIANESDQVT